ncbi:transcriptional regulator, partial [Klebsiella pneumoniae]
MFSHAAVASLNNLEMMVYHYVIKNRDKVMYMTIRELAAAAGVSTTTALRFFSNVGKFSNHIDDPYFPVTNDMARNALAIVLSVSGETEEI